MKTTKSVKRVLSVVLAIVTFASCAFGASAYFLVPCEDKRASTFRDGSWMAYDYPISAYDSRDYGRVTPVKHQGNLPYCVTFAAVAAIESCIISKGYESNPDISEKFVIQGTLGLPGEDSIIRESFTGTSPDVDIISEQVSLVYEDEYSKYPDVSLGKVTEGVLLNSRCPYTVREFAELFNPNDVKDWIVNNGAVIASTYVEYKHGHNVYNNGFSSEHHEICIVGWDDSYPKENFKSFRGDTPEIDGAWLFKNSWGTDWGEEGYGWVSYMDTNLKSFWGYDVIKRDSKAYITNSTADHSSIIGARPGDSMTVTEYYTADEDMNLQYFTYYSDAYTHLEISLITKNQTYKTEADSKHYGVNYADLPGIPVKKGETFELTMKITSNSDVHSGGISCEARYPTRDCKGQEGRCLVNGVDITEYYKGKYENADAYDLATTGLWITFFGDSDSEKYRVKNRPEDLEKTKIDTPETNDNEQYVTPTNNSIFSTILRVIVRICNTIVSFVRNIFSIIM